MTSFEKMDTTEKLDESKCQQHKITVEAKRARLEKALQDAKDISELHNWDASDYETRPGELDDLEGILYTDDEKEEYSAGERWDKWVVEKRSRMRKEKRGKAKHAQADAISSSEDEQFSAAGNQPTPATVRLTRGLIPSRGIVARFGRREASTRKPEAGWL